jgi:hypothetical protein
VLYGETRAAVGDDWHQLQNQRPDQELTVSGLAVGISGWES